MAEPKTHPGTTDHDAAAADGPGDDPAAADGPGDGASRSTAGTIRPRRQLRRVRGGHTGRSVALLVMAVLVLSAAGALSAELAGRGTPGATLSDRGTVHVTSSPGGSSKALPAGNAALMGLVDLKGTTAPPFTLTDQNGQTISLAQLDRSHVVVLSFMDDKCTDICPIVANELADAHADLGATASKVDFVAVNVNAAHNATATLRSFIAVQGHGVGTLPDFHYLTGTGSALRRVWRDYGITVKVDATVGKVLHSEGLYFIAPGGVERFEATPYANMRRNGTGWLPPATITQWGEGIAQYAKAADR